MIRIVVDNPADKAAILALHESPFSLLDNLDYQIQEDRGTHLSPVAGSSRNNYTVTSTIGHPLGGAGGGGGTSTSPNATGGPGPKRWCCGTSVFHDHAVDCQVAPLGGNGGHVLPRPIGPDYD